MIKYPKKRYEKFLNTAHRYFVYTSLAFTLVTTGFIGYRFYQHFNNKLRTKNINNNKTDITISKNDEYLEKFSSADKVPKENTSNYS